MIFLVSNVTCLQFLLIGAGLCFLVVAFSAMKREMPHCRRYTGHNVSPDDGDQPITPRLPSLRPSFRETRDYYEMERTPPGVRPAELLKTAKVKYFDGHSAQRADT